MRSALTGRKRETNQLLLSQGNDSLAHRIAVNEIACKGEVFVKASSEEGCRA